MWHFLHSLHPSHSMHPAHSLHPSHPLHPAHPLHPLHPRYFPLRTYTLLLNVRSSNSGPPPLIVPTIERVRLMR